jgi:hypothetical protein
MTTMSLPISRGATSIVLAVIGAIALGCNASAGNDEGGTSAGPPYFKAYKAEASSATQGATGVVSWSVGIYSRGMMVVGRDGAGKTIVQFTVDRTGGETRYDFRAGADAATMTIGHDGDRAIMRENTFYKNQEIQRAFTFLDSDLNAHGDGVPTAQASPSSPSKGAISTRGVPLLPNGPCSLLFNQTCSGKADAIRAAEDDIPKKCGPDCPVGGFERRFDDAFGFCEECLNADLARAVAQQDVDRCANNVRNQCGLLDGHGFKNNEYDQCLNSGLPITQDQCCEYSGGKATNGACGL